MTNTIRQRWAEGKAVVNGWLAIPSAFSAEVMAQAGWDSLTVDMQHGVQDYQSVLACFQGVQLHNITPMVRVPWNEPGIIGKVLDAGAMGVIAPMINNAEEAQALVAACRYPPLGGRSFGPIRAGMYGEGGAAFVANANQDVLVFAMIETRAGLDNLDAILDVAGIDALYVGPNDLGLAIGLDPRLDREEPAILAAYDRTLAAAHKRGKHVAVHCGSGAYAARAVAMGFDLVTIMNDSGLMLSAARAALAVARGQAK